MPINCETLILEQREHVAIIQLNRPEVMNAINQQMRDELSELLHELRHDNSIRAVVLSAVGHQAFCAGMDLKEFSKQMADTPLSEMRRFRWERGESIAHFDKPIIAAINGLAIGGGVELALLCDICFAAEDASFTFAEVSRGLIPGNGATQRLARRIGRSHALELILSARTVSAKEAGTLGLVDHVVPASELIDQALALANLISNNAPIAVCSAKAAIVRGLDLSLEAGLNLERDLATFIYTTQDAKEGPRAFVEKRAAQWKNL
jgi:enoyl-CoA hydratase/carnithine racemase